MEYTSCYQLEHGIVFDIHNNIKPCCTGLTRASNELFYQRGFDGVFFNVDEYIKRWLGFIEMMQKGNLPEQCIGCFCLEKKNWEEEKFVRSIVIANETKCSCDCFYCDFSSNKQYFNRRKSYSIIPVLKTLKERNLIKNPVISFTSGECTEFSPEYLDEIINFTRSVEGYLGVYSSGINYSKSIANMIKLLRANINISVDSGTKETYEKIKRVKAFDKVWENIESYQSNAIPNECWGRVIVKYIIIPGVNDNLNELSAFFNKVRQAGCKYVMITVEYNWWACNCNSILPKHLWELLDYIEYNKKDLDIVYFETAIYLWQKRLEQDKNYKGKNPCL